MSTIRMTLPPKQRRISPRNRPQLRREIGYRRFFICIACPNVVPVPAVRPDESGLQQSLVVPHDQMTVDLLHQVERHAHRNQQAGAAVKIGD